MQGDEPLIDPAVLTDLVAPLQTDSSLQMSTVCCAISDPADYTDPNVVKVVKRPNGDALYFSRAPIPAAGPAKAGHYDPSSALSDVASGFSRTNVPFKHIGLYAYRREFLLALAALPQTPLELAESLEQLRALEHGVHIRTIETQYDSLGVDTPEDLERARMRLVRLKPDTTHDATRTGEVA